ncbi:hypothetical protein HFN47_35505 [Rhizobium leguminosarum]|nr:hypothetical protein [Rhizobium leguminosarum]MBY5863066.1 hypothetical protein [Rhizobium leguminosarum]
MRGPGTELNAQRAAGTSRELYAYMSIMCADAGLAPASANYVTGCPNRLDADGYRTMLQAGFNEINAGCRSYIQFVFEERMRERRFKSSVSAIQAFISGVLTLEEAGTKLFSYLILSSSAANAFYDASRIDPLQGMTVENILKIVNKRQAAFERAAASRAVTSSPQLVRVWREYQWICTPLAISSDFNSLAAATVDGRKVDFDADARRLVDSITDTIGRVKKFDPNIGLTPAPKVVSVEGAVSAIEKALKPDEVMKIQSALCVAPDRKFGQDTRAAINVWRRMTSKENKIDDAKLNEGMSTNEVDYLVRTVSCVSLGFKTAVERGYVYDAALREDKATTASVASGQAKNLLNIAQALDVKISLGETRITPDMRLAIRKKREGLALQKGDYIDYELFINLFK